MKVKDLGRKGTWREVADAARTTVSMEPGTGEPSSKWKKQMLLSEHSPIRKLVFRGKWVNLPYYVSVHFTRHKIGIEHWVSTQRTDRTGEDRTKKAQDYPVLHEVELNAQAVINISRKRLCDQAADKTTEAWVAFLNKVIKPNCPVLYEVAAPECVYRGFCPESDSCGFHESAQYQVVLKNYRQVNK